MKNKNIIVCLVVINAALISCSSSQELKVAEPTISHSVERTAEGALAQIETQTVEAEVLVVAKDQKARTLNIKNSEGAVSKLQVGPEIKRFDEISVGDKIKVVLAHAVAFEVVPVSKEELANPTEAVLAAVKNPAEVAPGMAVGAIVKTIVTIKQIDLKANTVTVQKEDGSLATVVAKYPENLTRVKVGDTVVVAYIDAVAIELEKL